jgi:hypothetical protein
MNPKLIVVLIIFYAGVSAMDPPVLPEKFTEAFLMHIDNNYDVTFDFPGQIWFDDVSKAIRLDSANLFYLCYGLYP